jgi:catechol 2,3-dioxygenase-like lactoylglutathione lyase family enzyme
LAFRVADRNKTSEFFQTALGYKFQTQFTIDFGDGETAECIALEPSEKTGANLPWTHFVPGGAEYHLPPEIFISDGTPNSIVGKWVESRGGIGGLHHIALQVTSVEDKMKEWIEKGYAEFASEAPFRCPGLTQVFTKPSLLCGVVFEFIERQEVGFCKDNVKNLMSHSIDKTL